MDIGHILFIVDWAIVAVGAVGAVTALITMAKHQYRD
jgi:hypothetical protein